MSPSTSYSPESSYAWTRLAAALVVGTIACVGNWSVVVALPTVQQEFAVARAGASLPYTIGMIGFGLGGVMMGRIADRANVALTVVIGGVCLGLGYVAASLSATLWQFTLAHALLGLGASAGFAPLMADMSHWFTKRRGLAVVIAACGSYLAGAIWPQLIQHFIDTQGWRWAHAALGVITAATLIPLSLFFLPRPSQHMLDAAPAAAANARGDLKLTPNGLQMLLVVAGFACCVAMSMPQVHIVAYCGDLGYGVARGAEMLSLMLGLGIVSRIASGVISDRIGGVRTLLIGSIMQGAALALYLFFNGLTSLYAISAIFGLFQGGIVPMYAVIIREYLPPREAGVRIGLVMGSTIFGMAFGGWMSGLIFDLTASYRMAFLNGLAWNMLNLTIAIWLLMRPGRVARAAGATG